MPSFSWSVNRSSLPVFCRHGIIFISAATRSVTSSRDTTPHTSLLDSLPLLAIFLSSAVFFIGEVYNGIFLGSTYLNLDLRVYSPISQASNLCLPRPPQPIVPLGFWPSLPASCLLRFMTFSSQRARCRSIPHNWFEDLMTLLVFYLNSS